MNMVTVVHEPGEWAQGSIYISPAPQTPDIQPIPGTSHTSEIIDDALCIEWHDATPKSAVRLVHAALRHCGIAAPDAIWSHLNQVNTPSFSHER